MPLVDCKIIQVLAVTIGVFSSKGTFGFLMSGKMNLKRGSPGTQASLTTSLQVEFQGGIRESSLEVATMPKHASVVMNPFLIGVSLVYYHSLSLLGQSLLFLRHIT